MVITDFLERNARLYGADIALVEINPSEERDRAVTWRDFSLIQSTNPNAPYRREMSWADFDRRANRFANLLLTLLGVVLAFGYKWWSLRLYRGQDTDWGNLIDGFSMAGTAVFIGDQDAGIFYVLHKSFNISFPVIPPLPSVPGD